MDGKEYQGNGIRRQGYQFDFFFWTLFSRGLGLLEDQNDFVGASTTAMPWSKLFSST